MITAHHRPFWHTVAAAIRSRDGRIWTGVHLGATVGRLAICAEPIALGRAILEGDGTMLVGVAVRHRKPEEGTYNIQRPQEMPDNADMKSHSILCFRRARIA